MPLVLFLAGLWCLVMGFNALRPRYTPIPLAAVSFFAGWLTSELAPHVVIINVAIVAWLCWHGADVGWLGRLGLVMDALGLVLLLISTRDSWRSGRVVATALADFDDDELGERRDWRQLLLPLPVRDGRVERLRNIQYGDGPRHKLDVFRRRGGSFGRDAKRPVLLFVHGGAWVIGNKEHQGLPLLQRFAVDGWVGFSINYGLSPRATWPTHIVDVKRAIAWVRAHAAEYGGDPDFIVIAGGSAGGHLASLASLTPERRDWQPGFEEADTRVSACISFYGVYDFTIRDHWRNPGLSRVLERYVFKASRTDELARFEDASPIAHIHADAPPFLVVHGSNDTVVPVGEARLFVHAMERAGASVAYLEIPGAQHAFEIFPSLRTLRVVRGCERFVAWVQKRRAGATHAASAEADAASVAADARH